MVSEYLQSIEQNGFAIVPGVLSPSAIANLIFSLEQVSVGTTAMIRRQSVYGIRNLLRLSPAVRDMAQSAALRSFVEPVLGTGAFAVRAIYFDKTRENNWPVAWHQDLAVPVKQKLATDGFGPWTIKAGTLHALAPASVLEKMLTIRLHLDHTTQANGALCVIPGSHHQGRMDSEGITEQLAQMPATICEVSAGGVLAMRPLLLHSSASAQQPSHRRVLHVEFAAHRLPDGLEWDCA